MVRNYTYPCDKTRQGAPEHSTNIERQETGNASVIFRRNYKILVYRFDVGVHCRKYRKCDKENEKNIVQLR